MASSETSGTGSKKQKHPVALVRLQQSAQRRRRYVAQLPWWRHPLIGYAMSVLGVALGLLIMFLEHYFFPPIDFPGSVLLLPVLFIALFWGVGPALVAVLLSTVALDYFFLPPFQSAFVAWKNASQILPFFLVAVVIAIITAQREAARQRAFYAEQDLQAYAQDLEEANQKLEQASRMKDNFLSRASHELKTPLTVIRGQAQLALRRLPRATLPDQELIRTALERIEAQTHRLHGLIDDLLDISLLNSGKLRLRPQACNLGELCRDVVENHHLLTERDIRLELPPTPLMIQADSERMTQVLVNLVNNAVKYSPPESSVFVRVTQEADKVLISVHNEGPPIPQEQQANIFMPFYRTSDAQSSAQKGWGLGLAISKEIVEQHGGQIRVESGTDKGTTFFVSLPHNINTR